MGFLVFAGLVLIFLAGYVVGIKDAAYDRRRNPPTYCLFCEREIHATDRVILVNQMRAHEYCNVLNILKESDVEEIDA